MLTTNELHFGPDIFRPGTACYKSPKNPTLFIAPAHGPVIVEAGYLGHEAVITRPDVLPLLFGPAWAAILAGHTVDGHADYRGLRLEANKTNLFGRAARLRGEAVIFCWNPCRGWDRLLDRVIIALGAGDDTVLAFHRGSEFTVRQWRNHDPAKGR